MVIRLASTVINCAEIARNLRFRDRLRADRADRELYERTKRQLASRDWTYMQQYADAKGDVVEAIMQRAETAESEATDPEARHPAR